MHSTIHIHTQLARHTLRIADPDNSLPFYQEILGMTLLSERSKDGETHYYMGFVESGAEWPQVDLSLTHRQHGCFLELVHDAKRAADDAQNQSVATEAAEGYWKIAISVTDVNVARDRLVENGVEVDMPRQVGDIAYLCHFNDPDGYCIELIQHKFMQNHQPEADNPNFKLGTHPSFLLITYRVKDAKASLNFYTELLGMKLLSKQTVEAKGFTLYFLAHTADELPDPDVEHVGNREWLWQRPYTMVEFQHVWGTEDDAEFTYRVDSGSGFEGIGFVTNRMTELRQKLESHGYRTEASNDDALLRSLTATVCDPDGYSIRLIDSGAEK